MNSDIISVLYDIHDNCPEKYNKEQLMEYATHILKEIYKSKEIYHHYIKQHIYYVYPQLMTHHKMIFEEDSPMLSKLKQQVITLQKVPLPEQRSDEWFEFRKSRITASELATIFNANTFMSKEELILSKCGYNQEMDQFALDICQHGVIFEPIATLLYEQKNNCTVIEFGCLPHPDYDYIAASPDGITPEGVMLEIKCPMKRDIIGIPRIYYWYQMQLQLEVADLNRCDFLECDIQYYNDEKEFIMDSTEDSIYTSDAYNLNKGIIIEYYKNSKKQYVYYEPKNINSLTKEKELELLKIWWEEQIDIILNDEESDFLRTIYWKLVKYSCITVFRDREWFAESNPIIKNFWENEVLPVRNNEDKIQQLLINKNKKNSNKKKSKENYFKKNKKYLIDDS